MVCFILFSRETEVTFCVCVVCVSESFEAFWRPFEQQKERADSFLGKSEVVHFRDSSTVERRVDFPEAAY